MNTYARILDAVVQEIFYTDGDITEMFHPDIVWVDIDGISPVPAVSWAAAETAGSWSFSAPIVPPLSPEQMQSLFAGVRYEHETAGITVNGAAIATDRDSQALITGATVSAMLDSTYVCTWKTISGPITLSATQLIAIATAVRGHVQACFDREGVLVAAVNAGTYTDEMLTQGWPA